MTTFVAALVLASALAHASWNAMLKGKRGGPLSATAGLAIVWAIAGVPLVMLMPTPSAASWPHIGAALRETAVLFAAIIGSLVLGEPFGRRRIIAAGLVVVGIVGVRLGG